MNEQLLTIEDLCQELGIGKTTAYRLIKSGKLPHGKIGRRILIHRSELARFILEQTNSVTN